jgi:hypothetical protein
MRQSDHSPFVISQDQVMDAIEKRKTQTNPLSDTRLIDQLTGVQCTMAEIAAKLNISEDEAEKRFAPLVERGRLVGRANLRKWMWKAARKGDTKMMIWLSKQHLDMKDRFEGNTSGPQVLAQIIINPSSAAAPNEAIGEQAENRLPQL